MCFTTSFQERSLPPPLRLWPPLLLERLLASHPRLRWVMLGLSKKTSLTLSGSQSETERQQVCSSILLFNSVLEYSACVKTSAQKVFLLFACPCLAPGDLLKYAASRSS